MLRRALRHALTILSALSLLLCVTVCVLWVLSYAAPAHLKWQWRRYTHGDGVDRALLDETLTVDLHSARGGLAAHAQFQYTDYWSRPDDMKVDVSYGWANWLIDEQWEPRNEYPWRSPPKSGIRRGIGIDVYSSNQYIVDSTPPSIALHWRGVVFPHWSLMVLLVFPAAHFANKLRGRLHRRTGLLCRTCGYDLRASPERCPECGTPVQSAA